MTAALPMMQTRRSTAVQLTIFRFSQVTETRLLTTFGCSTAEITFSTRTAKEEAMTAFVQTRSNGTRQRAQSSRLPTAAKLFRHLHSSTSFRRKQLRLLCSLFRSSSASSLRTLPTEHPLHIFRTTLRSTESFPKLRARHPITRVSGMHS